MTSEDPEEGREGGGGTTRELAAVTQLLSGCLVTDKTLAGRGCKQPTSSLLGRRQLTYSLTVTVRASDYETCQRFGTTIGGARRGAACHSRGQGRPPR